MALEGLGSRLIFYLGCQSGAPRGDVHQYPKLHVSFGYLGTAGDIGAKPVPGERGTPQKVRRQGEGKAG